MKAVQRFWLELGASGFRVDMAGSITRKDKDAAAARRFWQECRHEVWGRDIFTVAEWSCPATALDGHGLHSDFLHWIPSYENLFRKGPDSSESWFHRNGQGDLHAFMQDYLKHYHATRNKGVICIPCGNHDLSRISIGRDALDLEIVHTFLLTMPGVPFIYNGDEIGMRQLSGLPIKEGCYGTRIGARTPMQWNHGPNLGFSEAAPAQLWNGIDSAPDAPTVAAQEVEADSLLHRLRALIALRRREPALRASANFTVLHCQPNAYPFVFLRTGPGGKRILVVLNPSECSFRVQIKTTGSLQRLRTTGCRVTQSTGKIRIEGQGRGYGIFRLNRVPVRLHAPVNFSFLIRKENGL